MQKKVTVGILSYKDKHYLEHGLPSLINQTYQNIEVLVCDNNEDPTNEIASWIKSSFPQFKVLNAGGNVGFGRGHNYLMQNATGEFYLCFNSDMFASSDYIQKLMQGFNQDPKVAVVTGKLLKWSNFPENPTQITENYIDTVGLLPHKNHYFAELGHAQKDIGQFDTLTEIWGCSGASPMFNLELLKQIQHSEGEFFDSNFFIYKEDIDLMYRLRWAGFKCIFQPEAVAWHDRTAENPGGFLENIKKRRSRPTYIKENSYLNQLILTYKNYSSSYTLETHFKTFFFHLKYTLYLLVFDFKTLKVLKKFKQLLPNLRQKRSAMPRSISAKQMEKWFQ